MKNLFMKLGCGLLCAALCVPVLSSCSTSSKINKLEEDERGIAFWEEANKQMESLNSYSMTIFADMTLNMQGADIVVDMNGLIVDMNESSEDYAYLSKTDMSMEMTYKGQTQTNTMKSLEGFIDGKMFISQTETEDGETSETAFWAPLSASEYIAHRTSDDDNGNDYDFDIDEDSCSNISCKRNDEKKWSATYSGFSDDDMEQFEDLLDGMDEIFGDTCELTDVVLSVAADKDFLIEGMELEFVFDWKKEDSEGKTVIVDDKSTLPVIKFRVLIDDYNEATVDENIDFSKYTEVDDIRIFNTLDDELDDIKDQSSGSVEFTATAKYQNNTNTTKTTITFKETNGKYGYEISFSDSTQKVVYSDGYLTSGSSREKMSEDEAKSAIESYLDYADFSIEKISNVKIIDEGVYEMTIKDPDFSEFDGIFTGINKKTSSAKLTVTVKDGELTKYQYDMTIKSTVASEGSMTVTTVCIYND